MKNQRNLNWAGLGFTAAAVIGAEIKGVDLLGVSILTVVFAIWAAITIRYETKLREEREKGE